jgi:hypothetical protein
VDCVLQPANSSIRPAWPSHSNLAGHDINRLVIVQVKPELIGFVNGYGADLGACLHARGDELRKSSVAAEQDQAWNAKPARPKRSSSTQSASEQIGEVQRWRFTPLERGAATLSGRLDTERARAE